MASFLRPTVRRLLLLLAAVTSINCQVKSEGLATLFGDASTTSSPDSPVTSPDGAGLGTGGQGAGGQGAGGALGSDAWVAIDGPGPGPGVGGASGATGPVVSSGGAVGIDAFTSPAGGRFGSGGAFGGVTGTGGRVGPSGLGGAALDAGDLRLDGTVVEVHAVSDSTLVQSDLPADTNTVELGGDSELLRDLGADQAPDLTPAPDVVEVGQDDVAPEVHADAALPLLWHDEFEGALKTAPDDSKWSYATWGPAGGVNNEKQQYTTSLDNVFLDGEGHLVIRALKSNQQIGTQYTSGRIHTKGNFQFKAGRLEVRAKLPAGIGSFPGIIAMGVDGGWPQCGELALMEQYGQDKSWFYSSAYAESTAGSGDTRNVRYDFPNNTTASTDFHVYSMDWYSDHIVFQVDGEEIMRTSYGLYSPFSLTPEYIVLDVAVGGNMGGAIDPAGFPMDMTVDYVRVYSLQ
jgi:beta-glucanase (GH16 family)